MLAVLLTVSGGQQLSAVFDKIGKKTDVEAATSRLAPLEAASLPVLNDAVVLGLRAGTGCAVLRGSLWLSVLTNNGSSSIISREFMCDK